jgi:hypothetical protein
MPAVNSFDPPGWDKPLDGVDAEILHDVRTAWYEADPPPEGLVDQVRFALDLVDIDVEMLELVETMRTAPTRGDEQIRRITFSDDGLAVMISVDSNPDGTVRLDGWLAPGAIYQIELRTAAGRVVATSDDDGRFMMDRVSRGLAQLVVLQHESGRERTVVTPTVEL